MLYSRYFLLSEKPKNLQIDFLFRTLFCWNVAKDLIKCGSPRRVFRQIFSPHFDWERRVAIDLLMGRPVSSQQWNKTQSRTRCRGLDLSLVVSINLVAYIVLQMKPDQLQLLYVRPLSNFFNSVHLVVCRAVGEKIWCHKIFNVIQVEKWQTASVSSNLEPKQFKTFSVMRTAFYFQTCPAANTRQSRRLWHHIYISPGF